MEPRLIIPSNETIEQGSIFSCTNIPRYETCKTWGIVITARCDMARWGKTRIVNFLPVVKYSDWLRRDLISLIATKKIEYVTNRINNLYNENKITEFIRKSFSIESIAQKLNEKARKSYDDLCDEKKLLQSIFSTNMAEYSKAIEILKRYNDLTKNYIDLLVKQELSGYYFINEVEVADPNPDHGYIVLFREVFSLSYETMEIILKSGINSLHKITNTVDRNMIKISENEEVYITGVLRSPDIEHLMQNFTSLFGRIGLKDQIIEIKSNLLNAIGVS